MKKLLTLFIWSLCLLCLWGCNNTSKNIDIDENIDSVMNENTNSNPWGFTYLSQSECYNSHGNINNNPKRDENWKIINCYDSEWKENWKRISYIDWQISLEENFKHGEYDWKIADYYTTNWQIHSEINVKNWELNWKAITYYFENWQIEKEENYKNGELDGEQVSFFLNWQIQEKKIYKNGKLDWKRTSYFENWQIREEEFYKNGELDEE